LYKKSQNTFHVEYFLIKNRAVNDIRYKNAVELEQVMDDDMTHAHSMLVAKVHKHTLIMYNIYCYSKGT